MLADHLLRLNKCRAYAVSVQLFEEVLCKNLCRLFVYLFFSIDDHNILDALILQNVTEFLAVACEHQGQHGRLALEIQVIERFQAQLHLLAILLLEKDFVLIQNTYHMCVDYQDLSPCTYIYQRPLLH